MNYNEFSWRNSADENLTKKEKKRKKNTQSVGVLTYGLMKCK